MPFYFRHLRLRDVRCTHPFVIVVVEKENGSADPAPACAGGEDIQAEGLDCWVAGAGSTGTGILYHRND